MPDKPDVQRIHVPAPLEAHPNEGRPTRSYYDFRAEDGDTVRTQRDPDGSWRWQLFGANGKLKLEQGNFSSEEDAERTARDTHGDGPEYIKEEV